ncbi:MAG: NADP-dependent isocitrate dehydrogenase, partial [Ignavibacterium sp.]|nr:NADP-dependent isocitrate dehydrogenase [Ignavibacterium sp.]
MFKVVLIKGDGIGPEIADAVVKIFEAAQVPITWFEKQAGLNVIDKHPTGIPEDTLKAIQEYKVALKGPTTTPVGTGHKSVNVTLRKSLELYANVRPAKSLPGVRTRFDNVDLIIVRENIEDTYGGIEHHQTADVAQALKLITRPGSIRIAKYAFEMARLYGRKKVMAVHKANIHKLTDGLFLKCFYEVAKEYPEIQSSDLIVDNTCMQLVTNPERFDVLVLPNLYGDIVSDLAAGLVGGLGVAPGGNIGDEVAIFESVHGSAPDIAGQGIANPTALLLSSFQMLQHIGLHKTKERIEKALIETLK